MIIGLKEQLLIFTNLGAFKTPQADGGEKKMMIKQVPYCCQAMEAFFFISRWMPPMRRSRWGA